MSEKEHWTLRKEITIGNILVTIAALASLVAAFYNLDSRLIRTESKLQDIEKHQSIEREEDREYRRSIQDKLDSIYEILIEGIRNGGGVR